MPLKLITPPATEPVTLIEIKLHLRLVDSIITAYTIPSASYAIAAAYRLEGAAVEALGYEVTAKLTAGTNGTGGTVDVKLQHRDLTTDPWADAGVAFAQVTEATDDAVYTKSYTGGKRYVRAVATVGTAACTFGVTFELLQIYTAEDTLLTGFIKAAREYAEKVQNRALISQTWELVLDDWPSGSVIEVPLPPLSSVASIKYKDSAGTETTWAATNYIVDTDSFLGRIVLADGISWPSTTLYPAGGIRIQFVAGYTTVPEVVRSAILLLVGHLYENREAGTERALQEIPFGVKALLGLDRVMPV